MMALRRPWMADIHSAMLRSEFSAWRVWNMRSVALSSPTIPVGRIDRDGIARIVDRPSLGVHLARHLLVPLDASRRQLLADEVVDRFDEQAAILREVLRCAQQAAGHDDGRLIVGTELLEHEAAREIAHVLAAQRRDVVVVEHDQVQPAVEHLLVDRDVGLDRQRLGRRGTAACAAACSGMSTMPEGLHLLRLAVLDTWKSSCFRPADEVAVPDRPRARLLRRSSPRP